MSERVIRFRIADWLVLTGRGEIAIALVGVAVVVVGALVDLPERSRAPTASARGSGGAVVSGSGSVSGAGGEAGTSRISKEGLLALVGGEVLPEGRASPAEILLTVSDAGVFSAGMAGGDGEVVLATGLGVGGPGFFRTTVACTTFSLVTFSSFVGGDTGSGGGAGVSSTITGTGGLSTFPVDELTGSGESLDAELRREVADDDGVGGVVVESAGEAGCGVSGVLHGLSFKVSFISLSGLGMSVGVSSGKQRFLSLCLWW